MADHGHQAALGEAGEEGEPEDEGGHGAQLGGVQPEPCAHEDHGERGGAQHSGPARVQPPHTPHHRQVSQQGPRQQHPWG